MRILDAKILVAAGHVEACGRPPTRVFLKLLISALEGCEDRLHIQAVFEGDDVAMRRGGESFGRGAKGLGGGDEEVASTLFSLPEQRDPLHQMPLGPEAQNLEVDLLACVYVSEREVRDERGLELR